MEYSVDDIIRGAFNKEPSKVKDAFEYLIAPKIMDAIQAKKMEVASNMFATSDEEDQQQEDDTDASQEDESAAEDNQAA